VIEPQTDERQRMADRKPLAVVSVSGGKDSTATALLAMDRMGRKNCRFVFADTGNEHELTLEYVNNYMPTVFGEVITLKADFSRQIAGKRAYVETKWPGKGVPDDIIRRALSILHPTGNAFLDLCLWKGRFPSRMAQFCTQELKRRPLDAYMLDRLYEGWELSSWRGIRRDESRNRKDAKDREMAAEGWMIERPIASWTAQQTVDFVRDRGVRLNPLYSLGMKRVGCMPCINCGKDELLEISKRFPDHVARIREWEAIVSAASKLGGTTFFSDAWDEENETILEFWDRLKIDGRIKWAETSWGGRQQDFVRQQEAEACSSLYGLCE
jgi:3'-phosphoadenosine 5'-phosphosulfate sulfotransferase (PAPS reductase)/FAD synthetase